MTRIAIQDFTLANPMYVGKTLAFYTIDSEGKKTSTLATLYAGPTGSELLENPQKLDSEGKVVTPAYIDMPVIGEVSGLGAGDVTTGIIPVTGRNRGAWVTGTAYYATELVQNNEGGALDKNWYVINNTHVAGVFDDDLVTGNLTLFFDFQQVIQEAQAGHGHEIDDVSGLVAALAAKLLAGNNLSDLPDKALSRENLGVKIGTDVLAPNGDGSQLTGVQGGGPGIGDTGQRINDPYIGTDTTLWDLNNTFTVDAGADTLSVGTDEKFKNGDIVYLETDGTLPAGLAVETPYRVVNAAAATLQLSTTFGGSAIDIADAGTGAHTIYKAVNVNAAGPITIESGFTVTVKPGCTWRVG